MRDDDYIFLGSRRPPDGLQLGIVAISRTVADHVKRQTIDGAIHEAGIKRVVEQRKADQAAWNFMIAMGNRAEWRQEYEISFPGKEDA